MQKFLPPIYRRGHSSFELDSCTPQIHAMREGKIRMHALKKGHYPGEPLMQNQLEGISSIGFWDAAFVQDWGLNPHRNKGVEICWLETGTTAFSIESKTFELQAGNFTLTRPWQLHKLGAPNIGAGKLHWLILDVSVRRPNQEWKWPDWLALTSSDKEELTRRLRHDENAVWNASPKIAATFRELAECVLNWKKPFTESRMIILLNQLLLEVLSVLSTQQMHENPELASRKHTVRLFLHDLAQNETSSQEQWTLPMMASQCGMGVTAFSQYCRDLVNNSPMEYVNRCRLDRAAHQLLEHPEHSVTEIAFLNRFNSSQYFATAFLKKFKMTPSNYRLLGKKSPAKLQPLKIN